MSDFFVTGPFEVPITTERKSRFVEKAGLNEFWAHAGVSQGKGGYVFAMRIGRGILPWYVGKTGKQVFRAECFTDNKLLRYNQCLVRPGRPVMFFVVLKTSRGRANLTSIRLLERFLIQAAHVRNPRIKNVQVIRNDRWGIDGVLLSDRVRPTKSAQTFKQMIGL